MLIQVIKTECLKLRRAPVWVAFLVLPLLAAVMGTFNYLQNLSLLSKEWYSLWTQHTLFSSFFFLPALIGVLAAYQWRLEHRENNWNSLMSAPVPLWMTVVGKLAVTGLMTALTLAFTGLLFCLSGRYAALSGKPPAELPRWLLLGFFGGLTISSVQLLLSMLIKSFAIPVAISLVGGIAGLLVANYGYGLYFPYSYLAMGMDANGAGALKLSSILPFMLGCATYTALFALLSVAALKRRDIETH